MARRRGDPARRQILRSPPDIMLTTPESLEAMLISTRVDHRALFSELRLIVIDELQAFASDDRGWHLLALIERLQRLAGRRIQRLALSATVGNPIRLLDWLRQGAPGRIVGPAYPPSEGDVTIDFVGSLDNAVAVLARMFRGERRLVFCDSRSRVEELASGLRAATCRPSCLIVRSASTSAGAPRQHSRTSAIA
jgi:ATP-dependent helicase Lhr and Lhr-like helicase